MARHDYSKDPSEIWGKDANGYDVPTQKDPLTGRHICRDCWDGKHKRGVCTEKECKCECYNGSSKGLSFAHPPKKGCEELQEFPDVGSFNL